MTKDYLEQIADKIALEIKKGNAVTDTYIYELIQLLVENEHLESEITNIQTTYKNDKKPKEKENQQIINKLITLICYLDLEEYKQSTILQRTNTGIIYVPVSKKIIIDTRNLTSIEVPPILIEEHQKELYHYLEVTQRILKEITYCFLSREEKNKKKKTLQEKILGLSYKEYLKNLKSSNKSEKQIEQILLRDDLYLDNKSQAPEERFAQVTSYNTLIEIMEYLSIPTEIESTILLESYQRLIEPYTNSSAPTCTYLKKLGYKSSVINEIITEGNKKNDQERFELGLNISTQMYQMLFKTEEELKRELHLMPR